MKYATFRQRRELYQTFLKDLQGFDTFDDYDMPDGTKTAAVNVQDFDELQDIIRSTKLTLQCDPAGIGYVAYPAQELC